MSGLLLVVTIAGAACLAALATARFQPQSVSAPERWTEMGWRRDRFPVVSPLCVVVGIAGAIVFIGSGFVSIIVYASRAAGRTSCSHWGQQTGYPTKFRVLYWADTGTCLAQTPNGHWVKNTQVFINVPEQSK